MRRSPWAQARANAATREARALLVANGLCPRCKGEPRPGRVTCDACAKKVSGYASTPAGIRQRRRRQKKFRQKRYHSRVNNGLCERCGEKNKSHRLACCDKCYARLISYNRRHGAPQRCCSFCHERGHSIVTCGAFRTAEHESRLIEMATARPGAQTEE